MNNEKHFTDELLGTVIVRKNKRNRFIILRIKEGKVVISIPYSCPYAKALEVLKEHQEKIYKNIQKSTFLLDEHAGLNTYSFTTKITRASRKNFYFSLKENILYISIPEETELSDKDIQAFLHKKVEYFMRLEANRLLPHRLQELAKIHHFTFNTVKINSSKGRWGSCSSRKDINLSLFLMLLPPYLIDYVLLHELCHTVEMNHGKNFWLLMDKVTDGKAKVYVKELKEKKTW